MKSSELFSEFSRLIDIVKKLRDPEKGCPWDLEQTHHSLLKNLVEESYEYIHAVENENEENMEEELGDLLLQVLLHSTIAEQEGLFNLKSIAKKLADKLIRRHPHIFGPNRPPLSSPMSPQDALAIWESVKAKEKEGVRQYPYAIGEESLRFPALMSAEKIGKKTRKIGFDWPKIAQVIYKVEEEWQELKEEIPPEAEAKKLNKARIEEEVGDFLFSMAQLARHLGIDSEDALRKANKKFISRFQKMEDLIRKEGRDIEKMPLEEMDAFWDQAKAAQAQAQVQARERKA